MSEGGEVCGEAVFVVRGGYGEHVSGSVNAWQWLRECACDAPTVNPRVGTGGTLRLAQTKEWGAGKVRVKRQEKKGRGGSVSILSH